MKTKFTEEYRDKFIRFIDKLSSNFISFKWWCSSLSEKNVFHENLFKILIDGYNKPKFSSFLKFFKNYYKSRRRCILNNISRHSDLLNIDIKKKYIGLITCIDNRNFDENGNFTESYFGKLYDVLLKKDNFILLPNILYTIKEEKAYPLLDKNNIKYLRYKECFNKIDIVKSLFKTLWFQPVKNKIFFNNKDITKLLKSIFLKETRNCIFFEYYLTYYSIKRIVRNGIKFERIIYPFENQPWEKVLCYSVKKFMPQTKLIGYMHTMTLPNLVSIFLGEYEKENMPQPDYIFTTGKLTANELKKYWKPEKIIENCALRYEYLFKIVQSAECRVQSEEYENGLEDKRIEDKQIDDNLAKMQKLSTEDTAHRTSHITHRTFTILLALSVDYKKSIRMLEKTYLAFEDKKDYTIIVKGHPTYDLKFDDFKSVQSAECRVQSKDNKTVQSAECRVQSKDNKTVQSAEYREQSKDNKAVNRDSDIKHSTSYIAQFTITNKPVSELLPECDIVLTSESTVGLEGIKMGIPMIEIDVDGFIPLSRFDYCPEIKISANSPKEIFKKVNDVLNWSDEKRNDYFEKANKFIDYCFNPASDDMIEKFVEI